MLSVKYNPVMRDFAVRMASGMEYTYPEEILTSRRDASEPVREAARVAKEHPFTWVEYVDAGGGNWKVTIPHVVVMYAVEMWRKPFPGESGEQMVAHTGPLSSETADRVIALGCPCGYWLKKVNG